MGRRARRRITHRQLRRVNPLAQPCLLSRPPPLPFPDCDPRIRHASGRARRRPHAQDFFAGTDPPGAGPHRRRRGANPGFQQRLSGSRPSNRQGSRRGKTHRSAGRRAHRAQGQSLHKLGNHHLQLEHAGEFPRALRRHHLQNARCRRRRRRREDQSRRIRDGLLHRKQRLQGHPQSLGHRPRPRRQQRWVRRGAGRGNVLRFPRLRHRWLHPPARFPLRRRRPQAHLWPRQPIRPRRLRLQPRSDRPLRLERPRCRPADERHQRPRSQGFHQRRPRRSRLSPGSRPAAQGPANRHRQRIPAYRRAGPPGERRDNGRREKLSGVGRARSSTFPSPTPNTASPPITSSPPAKPAATSPATTASISATAPRSR